MNRLGSGEGLMFFAFIFIMGILGAGIVWGVSSFFGSGYDGRNVEASTLLDSLKVCFQEHDFFSPGFDVSKECGLNANVIDDGKHFIFVNGSKSFIYGVSDYINQCNFEGAKLNSGYPVCVNGTFVKDGARFDVVVGSNQRGRRVNYG